MSRSRHQLVRPQIVAEIRVEEVRVGDGDAKPLLDSWIGMASRRSTQVFLYQREKAMQNQ